MEEDLKILEEIILNLKRLKELEESDRKRGIYSWSGIDDIDKKIQSLENLIARNKELEEENVILKKASGIAKDVKIEDVTKSVNKSLEEFMNDYLPKSKVREKIEELKGKIEYYKKCANIAKDRVEKRLMCDQINELKTAIKYFEEFLQEGDDK